MNVDRDMAERNRLANCVIFDGLRYSWQDPASLMNVGRGVAGRCIFAKGVIMDGPGHFQEGPTGSMNVDRGVAEEIGWPTVSSWMALDTSGGIL